MQTRVIFNPNLIGVIPKMKVELRHTNCNSVGRKGSVSWLDICWVARVYVVNEIRKLIVLGQRCIWTWSPQRQFKVICHRVGGWSRVGIFARNFEVNVSPSVVIKLVFKWMILGNIICPDINYTSISCCESFQPAPFKSSSALSNPDKFGCIKLLERTSKRTCSNRNTRSYSGRN